jgi:hypothetical protein
MRSRRIMKEESIMCPVKLVRDVLGQIPPTIAALIAILLLAIQQYFHLSGFQLPIDMLVLGAIILLISFLTDLKDLLIIKLQKSWNITNEDLQRMRK